MSDHYHEWENSGSNIHTDERPFPASDAPATQAILPQSTGQSTSTIDQAYEGVFSALDLLGGAPSAPSAATLASASGPFPQRSLPSLGTRVESILPERHLDALSEHTEPSSRQSSLRGSPNPALVGTPAAAFQPSTPHRSRGDTSGGNRPTHRSSASLSTESIASLAGRFPLPASPVKPRTGGSGGTATGSGTPQATPKRAIDLIKMFENRTGTEATPPPPQPSFATPAKSSSVSGPPKRPEAAADLAAAGSATIPADVFGSQDVRATEQQPALAPPPSAYRGPFRAYTDPDPLAPPPAAPPALVRAGAATPPASIRSAKAGSPLSSFRSLVASWKSRSGSPSQRVIGSPGGKGGDSVLSRGGDRGWNVSIRRRRRRDDRDVVGLAERAEEPTPQPFQPETQTSTAANDQSSHSRFDYATGAAQQSAPIHAEQEYGQLPAEASRAPSVRSFGQAPPSEPPRALTGEVSTCLVAICDESDQGQPIRTGTLWYLNVHDQTLAPNFEWVQADARLFHEGLHLAWRTRNGSYASAMLDMEFCEGESLMSSAQLRVWR